MRLSYISTQFVAAILTAAFATACLGQNASRLPGELAWTIGYDPKTFDPAKVDDQESELVRYLTAGVLLRFNRSSQKVEPQLAESWSLSADGKTLLFKLRAGLENVDPDPNAMMNVWLSSSPNQQWNPSEKTPATAWEAEIDRAMNLQASSLKDAERKKAVDRVQQIVADQQPFIYLVYPNALYAVSPKLEGVQPAVLAPGLVWNVERLRLKGTR